MCLETTIRSFWADKKLSDNQSVKDTATFLKSVHTKKKSLFLRLGSFILVKVGDGCDVVKGWGGACLPNLGNGSNFHHCFIKSKP